MKKEGLRKLEDRKKKRAYYWMILLNPVALAVYGAGAFYLWKLCQYGGVRRRLPVILFCAAAELCWMAVWSIWFYRKKELRDFGIFSRLALGLEAVVLVGVTCLSGMGILKSAEPNQGKLGWYLEERKNSREVPFVSDCVFESGITGIFDDLNEALSLPDTLYLANHFTETIAADGTVESAEAFFYGWDADGNLRTYLADYDRSRSGEIKVWLDGEAEADASELKKLMPLWEIPDGMELERWLEGKKAGASGYRLDYRGYETLGEGPAYALCAEPMDGPMKGKRWYLSGVEEQVAGDFSQESDSSVDWDQVFRELEQNRREAEQERIEGIKVNVCVQNRENGSVSYFFTKETGIRLWVADAAAGSRFYTLEKTKDGGKSWNTIHENPFDGSIGVATDLCFEDEEHGFLGLGFASGNYNAFYRTEDGGNTIRMIELPMETVPVENLQEYQSLCRANPALTVADAYGYQQTPWKEDGAWYMAVAMDSSGYPEGEQLLFSSEDGGDSWKYVGLR